MTQKYVCVETADSITLCLTKSQLLFLQCFRVQTAIFQKKEEDQNVMAIHSSRISAKRSEFMYLSPPSGTEWRFLKIKAGAPPLNQEGNKVLCITAARSVANSTVTIILPLFSSLKATWRRTRRITVWTFRQGIEALFLGQPPRKKQSSEQGASSPLWSLWQSRRWPRCPGLKV